MKPIITYYDLEKLKSRRCLTMEERKEVREESERLIRKYRLCKVLLRKGIVLQCSDS